MVLTPVFVLVSALLAAAPTDAPATLEVIPLQHRTVSEVLPQLLPIVGADGAIAGNGDQLFIRASPEVVAAVKARVAALDAKPREMRLTIRQVFARPQPLRLPGTTLGDAMSSSTFSEAPYDFFADEGREVAVPIRPDMADAKERARIGSEDAAIVDDSYRHAFGAALFLSAHVLDGDLVALEVVTRPSSLEERGELRTTIQGRRGEWVDVGRALDDQARQRGTTAPLTSGLRVRIEPID